MCLPFFHNWTKWTVVSDKYKSYATLLGITGTVREIVQKRTCKDCGYVKYKTIDI